MVSAARGRGGRVRAVDDGLRIRPLFTMPGIDMPIIVNDRATRDALREHFVAAGIDAVHVETEFGLAHAAADVAAELGIPVVHTVHTFYWASEDAWHGPLAPLGRALLGRVTGAAIPRGRFTPRPVDNLLRNLTLAMAMRADVVVSPSAHQARDLEDAGLPRPVEVVPNPIATSPRSPVPLVDTIGARPVFLWVARCEAVKRPLVFAEAAIDALARTGGGFSVDFVGDGTDRAALQRLVAEHPQIRVQGSLPHDTVLDMMDASSVVVLTSIGFDNQPMTIAEAVSRERGILYCDPKLREGLLHAGFLAATPDAAGIADAIVDLVTTDGLLRELSRGAARDGAQFSPHGYVSRLTGIVRGAQGLMPV
ncbi:MAG: hypothetical protein RI885_1925 [Actinomycetota bacterium]